LSERQCDQSSPNPASGTDAGGVQVRTGFEAVLQIEVAYIPQRVLRRIARAARRPRRRTRRPMRRPARRVSRRSIPTVCASAGSETNAGTVTPTTAAANQINSRRRDTASAITTSEVFALMSVRNLPHAVSLRLIPFPRERVAHSPLLIVSIYALASP
jgi:hypothetical protein